MATERQIASRLVYHMDGDTPVQEVSEFYSMIVGSKGVGDEVYLGVGAPGVGHVVYGITRIDATGVYGVVVEDTSRILEPWEVM